MTKELPGREELIDNGYMPDAGCWINPFTGFYMSFDEARRDWAERKENLGEEFDNE